MIKCAICLFKEREIEAVYTNGTDNLCEACLNGALDYYNGFKKIGAD
jgi:hypothetical protein